MKNILTLVFTLFALAGVAHGQPPISGTVRTANGPPPSARVQLRHRGTVVAEAKTDSAGNFVLPAGAAGDTLVAVDVYGFTDTVALATAPVSDHGYRLFLSFQTELVVIETLGPLANAGEMAAAIEQYNSESILVNTGTYRNGTFPPMYTPDRHFYYQLGVYTHDVGLNNAERRIYESR